MPLVKAVSVDITVKGTEDAKLKISQVTAKAEELKAVNPEIKVKIDSAKALIEARLLRAGLQAELSRSITETVDVHRSLLSRLSGLGGAGAGGGLFGQIGGGLGPLSGVAASPAGIAVIAGGASAAAVGVAALATGLVAATVGIGAFGALAIPTFTAVSGAVTKIATDTAAYQAATTKTAKSTDLAKIKADWAALDPAQTKAVKNVQAIQGQFSKLATAFEPQVMKVFNAFLPAISNLLPALSKFANAAAPAITGLFRQFSSFTGSAGFKSFVDQFSKLSGPAITAIGQGIGKVVTAVGSLFTKFSGKDVAHAINIVFDTIAGSIRVVAYLVGQLMHAWDQMSRAAQAAAHVAESAWNGLVRLVLQSVGTLLAGLAKAFSWAPIIGPELAKASAAFGAFEGNVLGGLGGIRGQAGITAASLAAVGFAAVNAFNAAALAGGLAHGKQPVAPPHAGGGWASGLSLVGERGPELVMTPPGSYVYTNQQTRGMLGGATYNVHVHTLVADRNTGRVVVEAIRAFEQGSGHGWRK